MVVAILIVDNFIFDASAATQYDVLDYNDFVTDVVFDSVGERVLVDFPQDLNFIQTSYYTTTTSSWKVIHMLEKQRNIRFNMGSSLGGFDEAPTQVRWVLRPLGYSVLKLSNIPENTGFWVRYGFTIRLDPDSNLINRITAKHSIQYYDKDFNAIAVVPHGEINYGKLLPGENQVVDLYSEFNVLPPDGAVYAMPRIECFYVLSYSHISSYRLLVDTSIPKYRIALGIGSHYRYLEQQQITNGYLDSMINGTNSQNQQAGIISGDMASAGNDLGSLSDSLEVSRPNINTGDFSPTFFTDTVSITALSNCFQQIWKNPIALSVITLIICLVLVSFIFFGSKR